MRGIIKKLVKALSILVLSAFIAGNLQMNEVKATDTNTVSGNMGPKFTWSLDRETGVFELNGTGNIPSLEGLDAPWQEYISEIRIVSFSSGIEKIGADFFRGMENLEEFHSPSAVDYLKMVMEDYGARPLEYAERLYFGGELVTDVVVPDGITAINDYAFYNCDSLETISFPESVELLGRGAFYDCDLLEDVTIPSKVLSVYPNCFNSCDLLSKVTFAHDSNDISRMSYIEYGAFVGTQLKELEAPANVFYISEYSLPATLEKLTVYNPECNIQPECGISFNTTVYGFTGSTAEAYANEISTFFVDVETEHEHVYKELVMPGYCVRKRCICGKEEGSVGHVDENKDVICDVCGRTTDDFSLTDTAEILLFPLEKLTLSYTAPEYGKYTFDFSDMRGVKEIHVYDAISGYELTSVWTSEERWTIDRILKAGQQVDVVVRNEYGCDAVNVSMAYEYMEEKHVHQYDSDYTVDKKATASANGSKSRHCIGCDAKIDETTIYKASGVKLATASFVYNGKQKTPKVIVKDSKGNVIDSSNYTISKPSGRKNVGKYTYKVKFKNEYSGTKNLTLTIKPKGTSLSSLTKAGKAITVKWKKQSAKMATARISGYQIQYSTNKNFKNAKMETVTGYNSTSKKLTELKAKKTYYVRVRTYRTVKVNGKSEKICSGWSGVKSVKTK